jgi:hypothetical protein
MRKFEGLMPGTITPRPIRAPEASQTPRLGCTVEVGLAAHEHDREDRAAANAQDDVVPDAASLLARLAPQRGEGADHEADEQRHEGGLVAAERRRHHDGEQHHADDPADADGDEVADVGPEPLAEVGQELDHRVVDLEDHGQDAAGQAGQDEADADGDALEESHQPGADRLRGVQVARRGGRRRRVGGRGLRHANLSVDGKGAFSSLPGPAVGTPTWAARGQPPPD